MFISYIHDARTKILFVNNNNYDNQTMWAVDEIW